MDDHFEVEFRSDHVHVQLGPGFQVGPGQQGTFWERVREECVEHGSHRVLVEGFPPEGERDTSEVVRAGQLLGTLPQLWMAFHLENFVPTDRTEVFEAVAGSKGARVKFFADHEHALQWLRHNSPS
ncbi:MAG TPA: hypothetical protein VGI80_02325 [Pyrinomonadaceae bacterium]|jgi:hypothetical protein